MADREPDRKLIQDKLDQLRHEINKTASTTFGSNLTWKNPQDSKACFSGPTPSEQAETLQYILAETRFLEDRFVLGIYDLPEFDPGSKNRITKLPGQDSNLRPAD